MATIDNTDCPQKVDLSLEPSPNSPNVGVNVNVSSTTPANVNDSLTNAKSSDNSITVPVTQLNVVVSESQQKDTPSTEESSKNSAITIIAIDAEPPKESDISYALHMDSLLEPPKKHHHKSKRSRDGSLSPTPLSASLSFESGPLIEAMEIKKGEPRTEKQEIQKSTDDEAFFRAQMAASSSPTTPKKQEDSKEPDSPKLDSIPDKKEDSPRPDSSEAKLRHRSPSIRASDSFSEFEPSLVLPAQASTDGPIERQLQESRKESTELRTYIQSMCDRNDEKLKKCVISWVFLF